MNLLPPGWEVPETLPRGLTVAPAADPEIAARLIADRVGGDVVVDVAAAERALAEQRARRRAERVIADAEEATRITARLRGSDAAADRALLAATGEAATEPPGLPAAPTSGGDGALATSAAVARLAGIVGDLTVDASAVRMAAARLRAAEVTAAAAVKVVGAPPATVLAEIELLRARSLATETAGEAQAASRDAVRPTTANGAVVASIGAALMLTASGLPIEVAACIPGMAGAATAGTWRRRHHRVRRLRREAIEAATCAERASSVKQQADDSRRRWEERAAAATAAAAELDDARAAWLALVGDADVSRADRLADALDVVALATERAGLPAGTPASAVAFELRRREEEARRAAEAAAEARRLHAEAVEAACDRERLRERLRELLHGRRLDRLHADAEHARAVLAAPAPQTIVLCDPLARLGPGRRRALLHELERAAADGTFALVTSDEEALAWASTRGRADAGR